MLEDRALLAAVIVTNSTDETDYPIVDSTIADLIAHPGADGTISLREAIEASNNTAGDNSITFDPVTSGVPIELTQGGLEITNGVSITGLGAANTTVDGKSLSLIFNIHTTFEDPRAVTLDGLKLTGGKGNDAGAIRSQFAFQTVSNCIIEDNHATAATFSAGGGIHARSGVTVINSTISQNSAGGGGIFSLGAGVTVINSTISGNSALRIAGGGGSGGGISTSNGAPVTISNSTISGNTAAVLGGGIHAFGHLTISNSTISGNSANLANPASGGGGISVGRGRNLTVINSTISDNSGSYGGGIFHGGVLLGNTVTISNSIVAGNSDRDNFAPDLGGIFASVRVTVTNSLIGDNGITGLMPAPVGAPDDNGNFIGTAIAPIDPLLDPLADNGGPTQTMALLPGSPALNAGNDDLALDAAGMSLEYDQCGPGFARISGSSVDMGAYEFQINQAPTIAVPPAQTAYKDVDQAISGLSIGDPDGDNVTVTLQVGHGSLTLGSTASLTVSGNGGDSVTLAGSLADLNAALAGLVYRGGLNYSGGDTLAITASDGSLISSNSVVLTVQSADQQAADLQAQVNALLDSGVMNQGRADSLNVKLDLKDNAGDIGKVQSFLNEVAAYLNAGILTQAQADALTAAGKILLTSLTRQ